MTYPERTLIGGPLDGWVISSDATDFVHTEERPDGGVITYRYIDAPGDVPEMLYDGSWVE